MVFVIFAYPYRLYIMLKPHIKVAIILLFVIFHTKKTGFNNKPHTSFIVRPPNSPQYAVYDIFTFPYGAKHADI